MGSQDAPNQPAVCSHNLIGHVEALCEEAKRHGIRVCTWKNKPKSLMLPKKRIQTVQLHLIHRAAHNRQGEIGNANISITELTYIISYNIFASQNPII